MMNRTVFVGLLVLGVCLLAAGLPGATRIRLAHGDYDCSCNYYCPRYGISAGPCYDSDYWGWGYRPQYCCVSSHLDYDAPDQYDGFNSRK